MKAILIPVLLSFALFTVSPAQTCREVVRDVFGRIVQTIERQRQAGRTGRAVIRDASGRITGTAPPPWQLRQHDAYSIPRCQRKVGRIGDDSWQCIYIITEADRSSTGILLPEEY